MDCVVRIFLYIRKLKEKFPPFVSSVKLLRQ